MFCMSTLWCKCLVSLHCDAHNLYVCIVMQITCICYIVMYNTDRQVMLQYTIQTDKSCYNVTWLCLSVLWCKRLVCLHCDVNDLYVCIVMQITCMFYIVMYMICMPSLWSKRLVFLHCDTHNLYVCIVMQITCICYIVMYITCMSALWCRLLVYVTLWCTWLVCLHCDTDYLYMLHCDVRDLSVCIVM